ncbi:MAG TPA: preprotein translocase subunit SecG [Patescibacteria group bacterium]|nr:preprotein translocase subunit SecG [Patescibacteria group bacterium]
MIIFQILEVIIAALLIALILMQNQGSGLSGSFGGGGGEFYRSKRSIEKLLVWGTVFVTVMFGIVSLVLLIPR